MTSKDNAMAIAILKIAELFGKEYVKNNFHNACVSYPKTDDIMYEYFCGFEGNKKTNKWTVFARVLVNRENEEIVFLDYRLPNGERMKDPIKPVIYA